MRKVNDSLLGFSNPQDLLHSEFKEALRGMASSVCIVTTRDALGAPHGMAASSVVSLSFNPLSMLISVNQSASIFEKIEQSKVFCINVLTSRHEKIVEDFSNSAHRERRFDSDEWAFDAQGLPYLGDAQASIFCQQDGTLAYGTHTIFIGRVNRIERRGGNDPFVWHNGGRVHIRTLEQA